MSDSVALEAIEVHEGEVVNHILSDAEKEEFELRTKRILQAFQEVSYKTLAIWQDLKYIKDNRLYREKYDTFQDYCKNELARDNSQIYRLIKDAELKENMLLEAIDDTERLSIMSLKESNTRFIRTLPEDVQVAFWKIAYGIGITMLPKKEDGSIEMTTGYLNSIGERVSEVLSEGGVNIDGEFVPMSNVQQAAEIAGVDEETAKMILLSAGVKEEYFEVLKRQEQHIREKSMKNDVYTARGTVELRTDINGSDFPVIVDTKGNELDLCDLLLSFNNRFIHFSVRAPIREE